jgi:zinc transport system substrate-binding protein
MAGVATPDLIVRGFGSPHSYALRPSDAGRLETTDLVFWVGISLESFLAKPLAALAGETRVVTLIERDALTRIAARAGGAWDSSSDDDHLDEHSHGSFDPHLWLDPTNAAVVARIAGAELGAIDPVRRAIYTANAERIAARIDALDAELQAMLAPVARFPYVVFHDAYAYFERRYGLNAVGSVRLGPERNPGVRRLRAIRAQLRATGARCLFTEPQFGSALVATVIEGTGVRTAVLDPLGADLRPGPDAYFTLMRRLARSLRDCLEGR